MAGGKIIKLLLAPKVHLSRPLSAKRPNIRFHSEAYHFAPE
jgi:hypothetical protein